MSNESTEALEPEPRNPRYFTKEDEGVQVVYNLRDAAPYVDLGYEEVDEAAYLASLPDVFASPLPTVPEGD
ncbi:hypothetical protein [Streptomyces afghaniensis]|uniref:hypothetical protein n=1 Tax=Streptomyces afghaniensis TaxID=66865 RepID=UPI00277F34F4|nr:hypothetical protein [Streptomyces afghaniensis]MDQ1018958.1 hypothetical protein [Streptomyces afghaniensis]